MPDRNRRRWFVLGFGSFGLAWLSFLAYLGLCQVFSSTRWFGGTGWAVRMDFEGLNIWRHLTLWMTIPIFPLVPFAFGVSGVLCLGIGITELVQEALAKRRVGPRGFDVIVRPPSPSANSSLVSRKVSNP
jgi:hypothetical protein